MDVYSITLFLLVSLLIGASYWKYHRDSSNFSLSGADDPVRLKTIEEELHSLRYDTIVDRFFDFQVRFFSVYTLASAADWLQASFLYSLYKHTHELPESVIAFLFAAGFLCGGISATFLGVLADRFGRKRACLSYCILYSLSCLTVFSNNLSILALGRVLGGMSTTLLFTIFETWMIAEHHRLGFGRCDGALSSVYSFMSILNGLVAVASGIMSHHLVNLTGSEASPFVASIVCLFLAGILILTSWAENYGIKESGTSSSGATQHSSRVDLKSLVAIGSATCFLEGSVYLMIYSWPQAIISARQASFTWGQQQNPPFGLIFANFMCSLTLGSFFFAYLIKGGNSVQTSSSIVQLAMTTSSICLLLTVLYSTEAYRFWAFCLFEFCLGVYLPSMGYVKGNLIADDVRGKVYGYMRVPLNAYVVILLVTVEGGDASRENRFMLSSGLILLSTALMAVLVPSPLRP